MAEELAQAAMAQDYHAVWYEQQMAHAATLRNNAGQFSAGTLKSRYGGRLGRQPVKRLSMEEEAERLRRVRAKLLLADTGEDAAPPSDIFTRDLNDIPEARPMSEDVQLDAGLLRLQVGEHAFAVQLGDAAQTERRLAGSFVSGALATGTTMSNSSTVVIPLPSGANVTREAALALAQYVGCGHVQRRPLVEGPLAVMHLVTLAVLAHAALLPALFTSTLNMLEEFLVADATGKLGPDLLLEHGEGASSTAGASSATPLSAAALPFVPGRHVHTLEPPDTLMERPDTLARPDTRSEAGGDFAEGASSCLTRPPLGETACLALLDALCQNVLELDERCTSAVVKRVANALSRTELPERIASAARTHAACALVKRPELHGVLAASAEIRRLLLHGLGDAVLKRLLEYEKLLLEARGWLEPRVGLRLLCEAPLRGEADEAGGEEHDVDAAADAAVEQAYAWLECFEGKRPHAMPRSLKGLVAAAVGPASVSLWREYGQSCPEAVELARLLEKEHDVLCGAYHATIAQAEGRVSEPMAADAAIRALSIPRVIDVHETCDPVT